MNVCVCIESHIDFAAPGEHLLAVKVAEPCMRLHICEMDEQDFSYEISIYLPHSIHLRFSGPVVSVLMAGLHHSPKPERQISFSFMLLPGKLRQYLKGTTTLNAL